MCASSIGGSSTTSFWLGSLLRPTLVYTINLGWLRHSHYPANRLHPRASAALLTSQCTTPLGPQLHASASSRREEKCYTSTTNYRLKKTSFFSLSLSIYFLSISSRQESHLKSPHLQFYRALFSPWFIFTLGLIFSIFFALSVFYYPDAVSCLRWMELNLLTNLLKGLLADFQP